MTDNYTRQTRQADPYTDPEWLIWIKGIGRAIRQLLTRNG